MLIRYIKQEQDATREDGITLRRLVFQAKKCNDYLWWFSSHLNDKVIKFKKASWLKGAGEN